MAGASKSKNVRAAAAKAAVRSKPAAKRNSGKVNRKALSASIDKVIASLEKSVKSLRTRLVEAEEAIGTLIENARFEMSKRDSIESDLNELKAANELLPRNISAIVDNALSEARAPRFAERHSGTRRSPAGLPPEQLPTMA